MINPKQLAQEAPMLHAIGLSGGKDSTVLAFALKEREPETDWTYIMTEPTRYTPVSYKEQ